MSAKSLESQIIRLGEKNHIEELHKLLSKTSAKTLTTVLSEKLGRNDCITFWNYLLAGFDPSKASDVEKRFSCVKCFLDGLLRVELSYKQAYDLTTRLCQDLTSFPTVQLVEIMDHCIDCIRAGDQKCVSWKDLLPETLKELSEEPQLSVNGVKMTGTEYRKTTVCNLYTMRWTNQILTPIACLFKDLELSDSELLIVLKKFAGTFQALAPAELPALAYQLFSICRSASDIMIIILGFEKYFYHFYYKKLFADMLTNSTDFDSIDTFSDKELREAEETILHHLNYCTQYKISEVQMCAVLRNLFAMPDLILTPFMLSSIISMTAANREPDSQQLSTSLLLYFLRNVIQSNEHERTIAEYSVWCRDSLHRKQVDLEHIFTVLIDQNKEGKDVITPGLVNLAFVLLKAKNNNILNSLAINFLTKFIRKRFVFGKGIIEKLAKWMVVEQDQHQYGECLMLLSVVDTYTVSECLEAINYVLEVLLWVPGDEAMRMMSFMLPLLKISPKVRDAFIEMLRKAMNSSDKRTCRMAVYGFCMILKQLNNSNSQRSQLGPSGFCTQQTISGYSLMSQAVLGSRDNPQRHFDMLTLEIIGLLRRCYTQPLEIKLTLYENLQRAVELNPRLVPHVLQFIDWHFRGYFHVARSDSSDEQAGDDVAVLFNKIVCAKDEYDNEVNVSDNLGRLVLFVSHCLVIFEKFEFDYNVREMHRLLNVSVEKVLAKNLKFVQNEGTLTTLKCELIAQQINFIEGLMAYSLLLSKQENENVKHLVPLFREHNKLTDTLNSLASNKKSSKKGQNANDIETTTINGVAVQKLNTNIENIWDLAIIEKLLRLLHEDIVPFAASRNATSLRSNVELVRYVLQVCATKVKSIRLEPDYKQLAHSKRTLKYLTDITKVLYERCIKRLPELWRDFDAKSAALAAEAFQQCLQTANVVYKKKFADVFLKGFDFHTINNCKEAPATIHSIIMDLMEYITPTSVSEEVAPNYRKDTDLAMIPQALLQALEVLYDNVSYENRLTIEAYNWLLTFCQTFEVHTKEMSLVHKLLFTQRQKTHSGSFFNGIALKLCELWGPIIDEEYVKECGETQNLSLKSLTEDSSESFLSHLCAALRKQIEDADYFVGKATNINYKYRITADEDREMCKAQLHSLERSICVQMCHITNALLSLTNTCLPMGTCVDNVLRLVLQHYLCLQNLAKHFLVCSTNMNVSVQSSKFDLLLRTVGKPLSDNFYALIDYIETNIFEQQEQAKKKMNPQTEKAKVLRETKMIPKIILSMENFNKHIILLAKKTDKRLPVLLHRGMVRDFQFRSTALKTAVERALSRRSESEMERSEEVAVEEETLLERMENEMASYVGNRDKDHSSNVETASGSSMPARNTRSARRSRAPQVDCSSDRETDENADLTTPEDGTILENESNRESGTQLLKNLAKINKKVKKRTLRESEQTDPDVVSAPAPPAKKRRGRQVKK